MFRPFALSGFRVEGTAFQNVDATFALPGFTNPNDDDFNGKLPSDLFLATRPKDGG